MKKLTVPTVYFSHLQLAGDEVVDCIWLEDSELPFWCVLPKQLLPGALRSRVELHVGSGVFDYPYRQTKLALGWGLRVVPGVRKSAFEKPVKEK